MRISLTEIFLLIFLLVIYGIRYVPPDDLMRHLIAYKHGYDMREVFAGWWPSFSPYIGFEIMAGFLHRMFKDMAIVAVQWLAVLSIFFSFRKNLEDCEENKKLFLSASCLILILPFILSARPKVFMVALFLYLLAENRKTPSVLVGSLAATTYHAFWFYILPLIPFKKYHILTLLTGLSFWLVYGGSEYLEFEKRLINIDEYRIPEITIGENRPLYPDLFLAYPYLIPLFILIPKDKKLFLPFLLFSLPNQIRYAEIIVPILLLGGKRLIPTASPFTLYLVFSFPFLLPSFVPENNSAALLRDIKSVKKEGLYLVQTFPLAFHLVYANTEARVLANPEVGFLPEHIQRVLADFTADCKTLKRLKADYILAVNLPRVPPCTEVLKITPSFTLLKLDKSG